MLLKEFRHKLFLANSNGPILEYGTMVGKRLFVRIATSTNAKMALVLSGLITQYRGQGRQKVENKIDYSGQLSGLRRFSNSCMRFS